ncbi:MAG: tail fiber domain-containing protein [Saprospiraceae bacterium]|nr:tail fiber domain-containing protein [Saprospiraceae bacterium]
MAIKTRETLYSIFTQGAIPSQSDYKDLIDSTLNRRDDRFFGLWRKGTRYCPGDVVIYDKSLYVLNRQEDGDCLSLSNASPDDGCYCSTTPPPEDENNWCLLQLAINDDDFEIVYNDDGSVTIIFQLNARVGIGTDQPEGRLEVSDHLQHGRLLLEPDDNGRPAITLVRLEEGVEKGRVKHHLGSRAEWSTDGLGYAFWRVQADASQTSVEQQQLAPKKQLPKETPPVLLFITSDERARPRIGIGAETPKGALDIHEAGRGQLVVHPGAIPEPGILLVNLQTAGAGCYSLSGLAEDHAFITTDADLRFKRGAELSTRLSGKPATDKTLMTIQKDGKIGIGTEKPKSSLEVTDDNSGAFRLHLAKDNPALSILNLRPVKAHPNTYMAMGPDDEHAIFITDSPSGFVFKKGNRCGQFDNEVNVNQGDKVAYITPLGKVGVRTTTPPKNYDLDVNGLSRSLTLHLQTDGANIDRTGSLDGEKVLEKLEKLIPIKFKWKGHTNAANEGEQLGFNAQNVFECFPELVKKTDNSKAVAYANMTAVLVQAVKEQQEMIKKLEQRICDLENNAAGTQSA